jgi:hypothetical protein
MKRGRRVMFVWAMLCFAGTVLAGVSRCGAQMDDTPLYTLHTYANLVQIPTLVLSWKDKPVPLIARERFSIRLDSGPAFRPTAMHIEGNDAIDLAVLLDASGDQKELLEHIDEAMAAMARSNLLPHDHVTVFAIDCALARAATVSADDADAIKSAVAAALSAPTLHGARARRCGGDIHLRDSLVLIGSELAHSPDRRVILAISDGAYDKSARSWEEARSFLAPNGVAVFAIHESYDPFVDGSTSGQELFRVLCESTGGMSFSGSAANLGARLRTFITLLRGRYILEFPRPSDNPSGNHQVDIRVPGTQDFIVYTGVLVPPRDPSTLTDPDTVPTAKSPATLGSRHPSTPNR